MKRSQRSVWALFGIALGAACSPSGLPTAPVAQAKRGLPLPSCSGADCSNAAALLAAARAFSNVQHDYLLDTSSAVAPGRGIELRADGSYAPVGIACARPRPGASAAARVTGGEPAAPSLSAPGLRPPAPRLSQASSAIDFRYVGLAVDSLLVGGDVELASTFGGGASIERRRVKLVAFALVADEDPQFYEATEDVSASATGRGCECGRATHFVGSVKRGAMIAYEMDLTAAEAHGSALALFKARLAHGDRSVRVTSAGALEMKGFDPTSESIAALRFEVTRAVPIAYAVYPVSDVCHFALPQPDITPLPVDLGFTPYGGTATRTVQFLNRAGVDVKVSRPGSEIVVPAFGTAGMTFAWTPEGAFAGCERQKRDESLLVTPKDASLPVVPRERNVTIPIELLTGMPTFSKHEPVATEKGRSPDYGKANVDWTCPSGYLVDTCETQMEHCSSSTGSCRSEGYRLSAEEVDGTGCRFRCNGPKSTLWGEHGCSYTAAMTCKLSCGGAGSAP